MKAIKINSFFLVWLGASLFLSCEDKKEVANVRYEGPVEEVQNVKVLYSEQGDLKVLMRTPKQLRFLNDNKVFPDTVNIDFYDPNGSVTTHLRADSGNYQKNEDIYVVKGNVRVNMSLTNQLLTTTELKWSPRTKKVFTEKHLTVRNRSTGEITHGVGMDAEQDFSRIKFRKGTGKYRVDIP
ncbi:LPS export ABC transporter protein LptC [Dyadobacter jejuensis]|uniref:LPS export ABC transporter protein LptC n=1 Tax=Dyadobacter jejuensis TaxID=1082580 RepID=A0A316AHJ4_9BACT|nr:LPS export ABC transporter periplasmic protein LptC [Dyadobacter jejuensis]PWJ57111.1 LPS export ABC transporter protein LptC [Dyadobacter jejuensis]